MNKVNFIYFWNNTQHHTSRIKKKKKKNQVKPTFYMCYFHMCNVHVLMINTLLNNQITIIKSNQEWIRNNIKNYELLLLLFKNNQTYNIKIDLRMNKEQDQK